MDGSSLATPRPSPADSTRPQPARPRAVVAARLRASRAPEVDGDAAQQILDLLVDAFIVLGPDGGVLATNRAARRLLDEDDGLALEARGPRAASSAETRALRQAISEVEPGRSRSLRIARPSGRPALSVVVASPEDNDGQIVLSVADPRSSGAPSPERLQSVYGLTPTEARVAAHLAAGCSLPQISELLGITVQTVRGHLKQAFSKTGTHRQPALVHLLLTGPARILV